MNKKKLGIIIGIAVIAIVGVLGAGKLVGKNDGQAVSETIMIKHDLGETEVPMNPERVVTLSYSTLDILDEMDLEEKVVGTAKDNLPSYLDEYSDEKIVSVGNLKEFSLETINELKPDLIIIEGRQTDSYEDLMAIAPTIQLGTDNTDYFGSLERNLTVLGEIFGKEDEAKNQLAALSERVEKISEKVKGEGLNALALMVSDGAMSVYGNGSRFSSIYDNFGFKATDTEIEVSKHGQNISYEYLLTKNPNYLFVIDKASATGSSEEPTAAKDILDNELVKSTDTHKNNNIIYLNGPAWYVGGAGLQSADLMIKDIEEAIK